MWCQIAIGIVTFVALSAYGFGQGQEEKKTVAPTVLVTVGRPNVWTMEQAHYLLEKNRAHDLGIAAADLGALDANEIVGLRIDALKTLFTAQAQFDQAAGAKNSSATSQYKVDTERYNRLRAQLDEVRSKQAAKDGELAAAQFELDRLNAQKSPDPAKVAEQTAVVARLRAEKTALDDQYQSISSSLGNEPTLSVTSTVPQDTGTPSAIGSNSTFDKLLSGIPAGTLGQPKIQASIKLDNYINLQYEIVAKQLTLLRDAVGPNKRVIFLELPQSIYATQKFKPYPDLPALWGYHLVQTWWQIDRVETVAPGEHADEQAAPPDASQLLRLRDICNSLSLVPDNLKKATDPCSAYRDLKLREYRDQERARTIGCSECAVGSANEHTEQKPTETECDKCRIIESTSESVLQLDPSLSNDTAERFAKWILDWRLGSIVTATSTDCKSAQDNSADNAMLPCGAYALDLIPRQSGLNVSDMHSVSHAYGFAGLFGLLSGFGAKARYERQRDQYSQFVQQEVFASAFGKGENRFGWTFGPLPGTKRLAPGLRTTYAVLVVPAHARTITLSALGCGYRRREVPKDPFQYDFRHDEDCSEHQHFVLEIPSSREGFQVERVFYKSVPSGQRTTLELIGDFTPQVGVLVNGTPLQKVVSIGQPMLEQIAFTVPDNAGDKDVKGVFEVVGGDKLVLSFSMPSAFTGTPQITVVTPAKAAAINSFSLWINTKDSTLSKRRTLRDKDVEPMFYLASAITRMSPEFSSSVGGPSVLLKIFGQGFKNNPSHGESATMLLNGVEFKQNSRKDTDLSSGEFRIDDDTHIRMHFSRDDQRYYPHWHVDFFLENAPGASSALDDPGPPLDAGCSLQGGGTGGKDSPFELRFTGRLLSNNFPPSSKDDNLVITSTALKSPEEWDVNATAGKSLKDAVVQLKGWDAHDFLFCACQGASRILACGKSKVVAQKQPKKPAPKKLGSTPKH